MLASTTMKMEKMRLITLKLGGKRLHKKIEKLRKPFFGNLIDNII